MPSANFKILSTVTAIQVTAATLQDAATFCGGTVLRPAYDEPCVSFSTPAGTRQAYVGTYIIQKANSFSVIPADIFEALYV